MSELRQTAVRTWRQDGGDDRTSVADPSLSTVPDYRLFHMQTDGDIVDVEEFFATSDETAINFAATRTGSHRGELWCWSDRRFVALVTREASRSR